MTRLMTPEAVDNLFIYPSGRARRLARKKLLPHIVLPDGSIRFDSDKMEQLLADGIIPAASSTARGQEVKHG